ncbi:MAG: asparaginase [Alphaproteobacteria bacterium]|nr:asparaginase [Alphaproteobacteria bacterium]
MSDSPILVDVWRGALAESRHRGAYVLVDADGRVVEAKGDPERAVFARSAIKPLLALPLIESGAAEAFSVRDDELALACASHSGEPFHVAAVTAWLGRIGLSVADLECGAHAPYHASSVKQLHAVGQEPTQAHNNCSGKHTGVLTTCRHLKDPTRGYIKPEHPAQQRLTRLLEEMCGVSLGNAPRGIDGCGFPQIAIPLHALAHGIARLGAPDRLSRERAGACRRIASAMAAHPAMVAGTDRFCTRALAAAKGKAVVKTGAEGVYMAAIPAKGYGIALKVDDGATRAAEVVMATLLIRHADLDAAQMAALQALQRPALTNVAGVVVGELRPGF